MVIEDMDDILHAKYLAICGIILGYPPCCIAEFITDSNHPDPWRKRKRGEIRKLSGTGFIPCSRCNTRYSEKTLLNIIEKNRIYPLSFKYFIGKTRESFDWELLTSFVDEPARRKIWNALSKVRFNIA